jgi:superfamily II DNA or RNA helicase
MASNTFYTIFEKRTPGAVLGLSATFDRLDGKHTLLNSYCPVCDEITVKEAIDNK